MEQNSQVLDLSKKLLVLSLRIWLTVCLDTGQSSTQIKAVTGAGCSPSGSPQFQELSIMLADLLYYIFSFIYLEDTDNVFSLDQKEY